MGCLPHVQEWRLGSAPVASSGWAADCVRQGVCTWFAPQPQSTVLALPCHCGGPSKQLLKKESLLTAFRTLPSLSNSFSTGLPQDHSNATSSEKPSWLPQAGALSFVFLDLGATCLYGIPPPCVVSSPVGGTHRGLSPHAG